MDNNPKNEEKLDDEVTETKVLTKEEEQESLDELREVIKENQRSIKKSRIFGYILTGVLGIAVTIVFYTTKLAVEAEERATQLNTSLENSLEVIKEKNIELEISEANLQGEKEKLELIQKSYDSLRQSLAKEKENLWNYTVEQNTLEAYTDYLNIRGEDGHGVVDKIRTFLTRTGYVQIQESNGTMLFDPLSNNDNDLYVPKTARSIRKGVLGKGGQQTVERNGDVILEGQIIQIVRDSIMSGNSRWAKIKY